MSSLTPGSQMRATLKRTAILFAVKPLTIIYAMSFAVTKTVNNQLWLDRTCKVNLNFSDEVCQNLRLPEYSNFTDKVQTTVNSYQVTQTYLELVPILLASLYLGPLSDRGRKRVMVLPFLGHIISGISSLIIVYYQNLEARFLWLQESYTIFGGFSVINIAMTGYIGDVTNIEERTALISILTGLTFCSFPLADFVGVQLYTNYGYPVVYWVSLSFIIIGIIYIQFIPESRKIKEEKKGGQLSYNCCTQLKTSFHTLVQAFKSIVKKRECGERKIIMIIVALGLLGSIRVDDNALLYTQKKFGWTSEDYGYFSSFTTVHIAVKTLIVLPVLCYCLQVHDCMLGILGYMSGIEENLVFAFATKGWMLYYASALSIIGGSRSTPETSILSKCVPASELGSVYTLFGVFRTIFSYLLLSFMKMVYNLTIDVFPGSGYAISAGISFFSMLVMIYLYVVVIRNEKIHGPLGSRSRDAKPL